MLPLPTPSAYAAFVGACIMVALGVIAESALAVMLGSAVLTGLASVFALTLPVGARLRRNRLELAWWHMPTSQALTTRGSVVAGAHFDVQASLRHFGSQPLVLSELVPAHGSGLRCVRGAHGAVVLPGQSRSEFSLGFVANAPGRMVLHGLSVMVHGPLDLFRAPLYFPIPLVLRALPRSAAVAHLPLCDAVSLSPKIVGRALRRHPGAGSELRELRELVPGDAFKTIAWKASAKAGKLMVREMESEVQQTLSVVLDISGTMRGGSPGERKLDYGIELAAALLREALERGDQAGLITVDGRIVGHVPPRDGLPHMARLDEALLGVTEVVDADLTEPDDREVAGLVARYIRHQDGREFRSSQGVDMAGLVKHIRAMLPNDSSDSASLDLDTLSSKHPEATKTALQMQVLRRFCQARGIELRYRSQPRSSTKVQGLSQALRTAAGESRMPRSLVVITDFDGVTDPSVLEATLRMLKARHHTVSCVVPDAQSFLPRPASRLVADLQFVFGLSESRHTAEMRTFLSRLGVQVAVSARRIAKERA